MRVTLLTLALVGLAIANPIPQEIDFAQVQAEPVPTATGPAVTAINQPPTYNVVAASASAAQAAATDPASASAKVKRGVNDPCGKQPDGYGPQSHNPDTPDSFSSNQAYTNISQNAATPQGYSQSFSNLYGTTSQGGYLGLYTLQSYDTVKCQQYCDAAPACFAINIYLERDPSLNPADACPNPSSTTNYKCTLWGSFITKDTATNKGQYRGQFGVVIAGSNGYNKLAAPPSYTNFTGPTELGGAINAPLNTTGYNTYVGMKYYPGPYDPSQCAASCQATTAYAQRHASKGFYNACNFFNSYVLSINNVPQGTYCSFYTQPWDKSYSTKYGQNRGSDYYAVSQSYAYTLSRQDRGQV
ncbi:hypothetical protein MMC14_005618 [Varicellaria rhodocarpa]|nr:hypothetical protein [Varicellaria rhodocarpa]